MAPTDILDKAIGSVAKVLPRTKSAEEIDPYSQEKAKCAARGGTWDPVTNTCILPPSKPEMTREGQKPQSIKDREALEQAGKGGPLVPEVFKSSETGRSSGITLPDGRTFLGLSPSDVEQIAGAEQAKNTLPEGTMPVGSSANFIRQQQESQQLAGQVGQFNQLGVSPTGLDYGEALTTGIIGAIPRALSLAATGAGIGFAGGAAVGAGVGSPVTAPAGAIIGGISGFVGGITSSMISNMKSQRSDTTTGQQRVLDEGKQTMKDWATWAKNDPSNKAYYLAEYNKVAAQIDQAYRQMRLDTSRDVAKFETAIPNLAEFEAFYAAGGERDTLDIEMQQALVQPASPEYEMLDLAYRRSENFK